MIILHVSSDPLPDARIERAARAARERGHHVSFAGGPVNGFHLNSNPFDATFELTWDTRARLHVGASWAHVKRQFEQAISKTKPDLIHAHNVFAAKAVDEFGLPFVYDDHEFWSGLIRAELEGFLSRLLLHPNSGKNLVLLRLGAGRWRRWEDQFVRNRPTIVVCDNTAIEYKRKGEKVLVIPNYPAKPEYEAIPEVSHAEVGDFAVMVGNEFSSRTNIRLSDEVLRTFSNGQAGNLTVIGDQFLKSQKSVESLGILPHKQMLRALTRFVLGLIPWRPHWFHKFCNPNKAYEYAHAGLTPVIPSTLEPVLATLQKFAVQFSSYDELWRIVRQIRSELDAFHNRRQEIQQFARTNLIWEKFESVLFTAYAQA